MHSTVVSPVDDQDADPRGSYAETVVLLPRLHRQLLDVIRHELERSCFHEINAVQGLLLYNVGCKVVTAGDLTSRGYYQGSNASHNLKKLVELGYVVSERSSTDRRAVQLRLTEKGMDVHFVLAALFQRQERELGSSDRLCQIDALNRELRAVEVYWIEQLRTAR